MTDNPGGKHDGFWCFAFYVSALLFMGWWFVTVARGEPDIAVLACGMAHYAVARTFR
jgi:hypothetical protein